MSGCDDSGWCDWTVLAMTKVMLRFRQWGDPQAPAVLLWPGGTRSAPYHFDETAPLLAAHGLRVIAVHPPGWATTTLPPEGYRPSALARDVLWMLDELGLARVAFAGYSWGAFVACHLAALAPSRLAAVALLDAGYSDFVDDPGYAPGTLAEHVARMRVAWPPYPSWQAVQDAAATVNLRPALRQRLCNGLREVDGQVVPIVPYEVLAAQLMGVEAEPIGPTYPALAALDAPILAIVAADTVAADWRAAGLARFRAQVPHADIQLVQTSHDLFGEEPELMVRLLNAWSRQAVW